ncbi:MAG TPA: Hsp20/alpha crystallin family protein [Pyrinomonadaceae bacterium]|nr:Hsp20/alpha crystallin family protein [Pyrinomonadaceae bacterium]
MKEETKKGTMDVALKTPETVNPFQMMRRFTQDMERLFEDFQGFTFPTFFKTDFAPFRMEFDNVEWVPQIEVLHNNGKFMVRADLPGLTKDDVTIEVTDDVLTLFGERKAEKEEKREGFYRSERTYGSFYRQIPLPEGAKTENAAATFNNGVLEITIPAPKVEPAIRKLEIKEPPKAKAVTATA